MSNTASTKQIEFINKLKAERDVEGINGQRLMAIAREMWRMDRFDVEVASTTIDGLLELPKRKTTTPSHEAPEGMHQLGERIFKVQRAVHGSGHMYAKELVDHTTGDEDPHFVFERAPGVVRQLSEDTKMSLQEAKWFGALYGVCCVCGRVLTNEDSIASGIGPVCAKGF